ncbi:ATP-binding protein [Sphingobacterium cellulitidis]|uniref:HAMP domain-containing sensor histidine kinase n=1 Tax=Sphingobacterium cellulitidis TaxID=1768011 RepID=UPI003C7DDE90
MKIKAKLYLGIGFLFLMILILAAVSTLFVSSLKKDTENVLSANYNSVEYARNMLHASDELHLNKEAIAQLENNFAKQQLNVTEQGEKEITARLADQLNKLKANPEDVQVGKDFRADLVKLMTVNMDAIVMKSDHAKETASNAFVLISVIGALCFLIGFVLFINLPSNIANPIKKLSESIKEISRQNYTHRVYFDGESEFAELAASYNTMAEKLQEYSNSKLDQILEEKKRVETLVNSMHDPVIGLDENRKIIFINDECLQVSGLKRKDLLHNNIDELINHNDLVRNLIDQNNRESTMKIFADNKESYFEKEVIPMEITPTGELKSQKIGEVIVLKNITTFKELDVAKTNFIATVSHELRTPIASIQLSSELLKHPRTGSLTDEQKTLLEGIEEDSLRLLRITSELLNVSQVETGNIKLYSQISDPLPIIQYALNATRMQAEQKHIEISTDIDENIAKIFVDEEKTAWVLTNFITNAIRYSPVNSKIMVSLKKENNHLLFSVKDHGKGIDAAYKNKVFDRYFQIPGSVRTGTGLGLSISKDFIENQGGKIGVDSELGVGSTFYFRLPMVTT